MNERFSGGDSVKILQWLSLYKRLSTKATEALTESEKKIIQDLEKKLAYVLEPATEASKTDQRRALRVRTHLELTITSKDHLQKVYLKNISGGGIYIETKELRPVGTAIGLKMKLPGDDTLFEIQGEVAWANPKNLRDLPMGMGVKFINLTTAQDAKIRRLVRESLEKEILGKQLHTSESPGKNEKKK